MLTFLLISLLLSIPVVNVQAVLRIRGNVAVIEYLVHGETAIELQSIAEVSQGRYKTNLTFALVTKEGKGIRLEAGGERARAIGEALAQREGLVYSPVDGLMRWIRK